MTRMKSYARFSRKAKPRDKVARTMAVVRASEIAMTAKSEFAPTINSSSNRLMFGSVRYDIKRQRTATSVLSSHSGNEDSDSEPMKKPPRNAASKMHKERETKSEGASNKRKGRRRGDGEQERVSSSANHDVAETNGSWTCHCGLWTCLCKPAELELSRDAADSEAPDEPSSNNSNSNGNSNKPSAKASPVEADTLEAALPNNGTPAAPTASKRGGKRQGAGRGRSNQAPTPSEREEKHSPRGEGGGGGGSGGGRETPIPPPPLAVNGARRGRRGQHAANESGESDRDAAANANGVTVNGSDADPDASGGGAHVTVSKKREPSMIELKRRAAAMVEWVEKAKDDLGRSSVVGLGLTSSPSRTNGNGVAEKQSQNQSHQSPLKSELGSVADMLHSRLLGWQVEYGAG